MSWRLQHGGGTPEFKNKYLYFKPEGPRVDVQAVGVEDEILPAQVEARRPVSEGPGGEAGPSVRQQVQGHVTGTCTGQGETTEPTGPRLGSFVQSWNSNFNISAETRVLI